MVHCCVCANCTNSNLSGHRVHVFPSKRSPVFNSWLKFVQVSRRNFNTNSINTKHSVVCSAHFLDSDYLEGDVLEYRMGFRTKQRIRLKPNAIPSVHTTSTKNTGTASKRKAGNGDSESCPGIMAAVVTHQAVTELLPAVCRKLEASKELRTCTALSSSRMQAGVCLREDTEPAPAELREQDRISPEEEQLSGLEPVPMAEPERDCAAPALSSLQPECVTAHREGRDAHHTHTSLIKTETELDSTLTGDLIKTESLDSSELGNVVHLQPDQIKTETDDGSYMKAEQCSDTQDFTCDDVKSEQMKCESGGSLESDVMNTVMNEECNKEEMNDLQTACGGITQHCEKPGAGGQSSFIQEGKHSATSKKMCEENELKHSQPENSFMKPCLLKQSKTTQANGKPYKRIQSGKNSMRATCVKDRRIDTGEKPYRCTCCGKGFSHTSSLSRHHRIHSAEKTYKCTLCRKRFNCASSLNEHQKIHTEQKYYKCTECGKCFKHSSSLCRHQRIHKGENAHENTLGFDLNPQRINSGLKWVFEKLSDLNPHQRTQTCKGPYSCIYCGKNFKYSYSLSRHERNHSGEKPFECTLCGRCFNCTSDLNVHQRIHTGEKPKKCMQCGRCFNHTSSLNKHLRIHSGEKPYKCTRCEKCFISKSSLNDHVRIHTGEKPYRCTYCGKCFNQSTNLTQHLRYHTGEKPYRCSHCTMCFNQATTLKKHLRTHTGERPYTCVQCGKCFTCKSNLNNHMRIHTGEKPFKCTHCGKCFNQASHLTQHLKIHSGANPYKCTECKKCFSQASALKKHLKVHTDKWL